MDINLPEGYAARAPEDSDAEALARLIEGCFLEYEGAYLDLADLDSDLKAYASSLKAQNGEGIVVIDTTSGALIGTIACAPVTSEAFELKRLYIQKEHRGAGLAPTMLAYIEGRATARGAKLMQLWTDTRFERGHAFYHREGYVKQTETRDLHDISNTTEYLFIKNLK